MNLTDIILKTGSQTQKGIYCMILFGAETGNTVAREIIIAVTFRGLMTKKGHERDFWGARNLYLHLEDCYRGMPTLLT